MNSLYTLNPASAEYEQVVTTIEAPAGVSMDDFLIGEMLSDPEFLPYDVQAGLQDERSKWKVVSAMQKAIRRGMVDEAQKYACALNRFNSWYTWRRLKIIAFEDLGVMNIPLTALVATLAQKTKWMAESGKSDNITAFIAKMMARSVKDRSICDLSNLATTTAEWEAVKSGPRDYDQEPVFLSLLSKDNPLPVQLVQARLLTGSVPDANEKWKASHAKEYFLRVLSGPSVVQHAVIKGLFDTEGLPCGMPMLWDEYVKTPLHLRLVVDERQQLTATTIVSNVISCALDGHVLEGKKALHYWLKVDQDLQERILALGVKDPGAFMKSVVFHAEGSQVNFRAGYPYHDWLLSEQRRVNAIGYGVSYDQFMVMVGLARERIDGLNKARARVCS